MFGISSLFFSLLASSFIHAQDSGQAILNDSLDPVTQCTPYSLPGLDTTQFPPVWTSPIPNSFLQTSEFQAINQSIDWSKVPSISPNKLDSTGAIIVQGYNTQQDPNCWWTASQCTTPKHDGLNSDVINCPEPNTLGLTYDDGPNCSHNSFYDYLQSNNQKASLFFIGSNVLDWPYQAQRGLKDGHHIAAHTYTHPPMTSLSNDQVVAELFYTQKAIKSVIGITPKYWRPPFGDVDDRVRAIAQQLNLKTIIWNADTKDFSITTLGEASVDTNYQSIVQMGSTSATSGFIILSHEINNSTMSEAVKFYPQLHQAFSHIMPVASCLNESYPYTETNVSYPNFSTYISGSINTTITQSSNSTNNTTNNTTNINTTGNTTNQTSPTKNSSSSSLFQSSATSSVTHTLLYYLLFVMAFISLPFSL